MIRILLTTLLLAVLADPGVAQPPDTQEPAPRLRKKKKTDPPPMDEPAKPDKKPEPEKKPEEPKKRPGIEEDERLDDKDDMNLPGGEAEDEAAILERIIRNARTSEERLAKRELGEPTRQTQEEIVKDLEALIKQSQNAQDQDQNNDQDQDPQQGSPQGGKKQKQKGQGQAQGQPNQGGRSQKRMQRQQARQQRGGSPGRNQGQQQARNGQQRPGNQAGTEPGGGGNGNADKPREIERKFDLWGHLPEKERALMNKEMEQKFMDKYEELTRQYYRIISEKSRRK